MSRDVNALALEERMPVSSADLSAAIAAASFSACSATVVGMGTMGTHVVNALRALGVRRLRLVSRSAARLESYQGVADVETHSGGVEQLVCEPAPDELGVIATPTAMLIAAAEHLVRLGFRHLLIEKPVSLWSRHIERFARFLEREGVEAFCAYNRVAYPSFHEVNACVAREGGATSCTYTFTEMIKPDWPQRFPPEELARWGIANSLHVMSLAHGLIGLPATWSGHRSGSLSWHPSGSLFIGFGVSDRAIPFTYHADWGSTGRWSVEVHTRVSSYRLCPLEQVFRRTTATGEWTMLPVNTFAPQVKVGIVEEVAAALNPELRALQPLVSLSEAAALTRYGEGVFGYAPE